MGYVNCMREIIILGFLCFVVRWKNLIALPLGACS